MRKFQLPNLGALLALLTLVLVAPLANAEEGGNGSGGGKGFLCPDSGPFGERIFLADTYSLSKSGVLDRVPRITFTTAAHLIDQKFPSKIFAHPNDKSKKIALGTMLAFVRNTLYFQEYPDFNPPDFADDNIAKVPAGCKKVQVALQDIKSGFIRMSKDIRGKFSNGDWLYLELHESLIALRNRPGADTTEIRAQVARLASVLSNPQTFSKEILEKIAAYENELPSKTLRLKTLYRMPKKLTCEPTWRAPRHQFQAPDIRRPQKITLTLAEGDGRVGEDSKYAIDIQYQVLGYTHRSIKAISSEANLSTRGDAPAEQLLDVGILGFHSVFETSKIRIEFNIDSYDPLTSQFVGQYDVDRADGLRVVELNSGNGIVCSSSEPTSFRIDERSRIGD